MPHKWRGQIVDRLSKTAGSDMVRNLKGIQDRAESWTSFSGCHLQLLKSVMPEPSLHFILDFNSNMQFQSMVMICVM